MSSNRFIFCFKASAAFSLHVGLPGIGKDCAVFLGGMFRPKTHGKVLLRGKRFMIPLMTKLTLVLFKHTLVNTCKHYQAYFTFVNYDFMPFILLYFHKKVQIAPYSLNFFDEAMQCRVQIKTSKPE